MEAMLTDLFGADEAISMQQYMRQNDQERSRAQHASWIGMWRPAVHEVHLSRVGQPLRW
jgi:hypothetical protein